MTETSRIHSQGPDPVPPPARRPAVGAVCEGTPWEMGLAQGRALSGSIAECRRALARLEPLRIEKPRLLPFSWFLRLAERKVGRQMASALARCDPEMLERARGIAAGSGARLEALLFLSALEPLVAAMAARQSRPGLGGCSAVAVRGRRSAAGEPIIAKNFDYLPLLQPFHIMRESRPRGGFQSLEFTLAPLPGAVDGVNEAGLAVALDYAFAVDSGSPAPTITMRIADALGRCRTAEDAVRRILAEERWGTGLIMLADASGDIRSLELSNTRGRDRAPEPGRDALVHTNCYALAEMREVEVAGDARYTDRVPEPLRGLPVLEPHAIRARRIAELLDGREAWDPEGLLALMADHGPSETPDSSSPCVHTTFWSTTASLQLFPASRRIRVSYGSACRAVMEELRL